MSVLTDLRDRVPVELQHAVQRIAGVFEGVHSFAPQMCSCDIFDGLGDDEDDDGELAA